MAGALGRSSILVAATVALLAGAARAEEPSKGFFALDFLTDEAVGLPSGGSWDVYQGSGKGRELIGSIANKNNGTYLGGGWGYRIIVGSRYGLRASLEMGGSWGHLFGSDLPWQVVSGENRFSGMVGLGYQHRFGPLVLHSATLIGGDSTTVDVANPIVPLPAGTAAATIGDGKSLSLTKASFRLGQQIGFHVQVGNGVLLYADATYDIDGEWRVRAGLGLGGDFDNLPFRRHRYYYQGPAEPAPVVHHNYINVAPYSTANIQVNSDGDAHVAIDAQPGSNVNVNVNAAGGVTVAPNGGGNVNPPPPTAE
jgi:hypothetical protein